MERRLLVMMSKQKAYIHLQSPIRSLTDPVHPNPTSHQQKRENIHP